MAKKSRFFPAFTWVSYSRKLASKIENLKNIGFFTEEEALAKDMRFVSGEEGSIEEGNKIAFHLLVDTSDGVIADAKFQAFGNSALLGAAEVAVELVLRKNYDQASRVSADLIDKQVADRSEQMAFPAETFPHINLVLSALDQALEKCRDIPLPENYVVSPVSTSDEKQTEYPGWTLLSNAQKIAVLEEVIEKDIRPYIELDAGGVKVLELKEDRELVIAYQGACTSCHSATGATLHAIEQILRSKVYPDLIVTPDMSLLTFS